MKYLILDVLNDFKCIGSSCPYTCCAGWTIKIDAESNSHYQNVSGDFGDQLRANILSHQDIFYFSLTNDGRCAFLDEHSLCRIYSELGEEHLCITCKTYPRINWIHGDLNFIGKNISCPEVARILFEADAPLSFGFSEDTSVVAADTNWELFNLFVAGMTTSIEILQSQDLPFRERLQSVTLFNYFFEEYLAEGKSCSALFDMFSSTDAIRNTLGSITVPNTNYLARIQLFGVLAENLHMITSNSSVLPLFSSAIDFLKNFNIDNLSMLWSHTNLSHIYEQYSVYFFSRGYMNSFPDKQPFMFIIQFLSLFYLQDLFIAVSTSQNQRDLTLSEIIEIYCKTARCYEHSYENKNLKTTYQLLKENKMDSLAFLLSLI